MFLQYLSFTQKPVSARERVDLDDSPVLRSFFARLPLVDLAETTFFYERLKEQLPRRGVSRPAASCNRLQKVFKQVTVC